MNTKKHPSFIKRMLSFILTAVMLISSLSAYAPTVYAADGLDAALSEPTEAHAPIVKYNEESGKYDVTFTISAPGESTMYIRGDFGDPINWSNQAMNKIPDTDLFTITLTMNRGNAIYGYGFQPGSNSSEWLNDPNDEGRRAGNSWFSIGDVPVMGYTVNDNGTVTFKVSNTTYKDSNVWINGNFLEAANLSIDNWTWDTGDTDQIRMENKGNGDFEYTVLIAPGIYAYKYFGGAPNWTAGFTGIDTYILNGDNLLVVPGVIISEPDSFKNPGEHSFTAATRKTDAFIDKDPDVTWSIKGTAPTGFSIDAQTGTVTTTNRAEAGQITVVAAWEGKTYEKTVDYSVDPAFTYTIEHDVQNNAYTFADAQEEYDTQEPLSVTIKNTGTGYLTGGTIALTSGNYFTLSKTSLAEIDSESNDTFAVTPKTGLSKGTYTDTVTVTAIPGGETAVFTVSFTVVKDPVITISAHPSSQSVTVGETATFTVTAVDSEGGTLGYQWKVNDKTGSWVNVVDDDVYLGSNTDTLRVTNSDLSKNGYQYYCVVSSDSGAVSKTSDIATLAVALPALGGTASISGVNQIGQELSVSTAGITGGSGTFSYQWKANGAEVGTNSTGYTIQNADAGKTITCTVTREDAAGSVIASFDSEKTVPYNIEIIKIGNTGTDNVTLSAALGRVGDKITLNYVLENGDVTNTLTFAGAAGLTDVDESDAGSQEYTVTADDAEDGVITITATFQHTSLTRDPIAFATPENITKTFAEYLSFTNAITNDHLGTGQITYKSSHQNVATVDNNGKVTIIGAGQTTITATKAADGLYAQATAHYTLTVDKAEQDAPIGIVGVAATDADASDGKLTGVTTDMEYKLKTDENYTPVTGTEVTGLAPGEYQVRYKETLNYNAGTDTVMTIGVKAITIAATADPAIGGTVTGAGDYSKNDDVTLAANPAAGYNFDGWYEDSDQISADLTYNFEATADRILTARFSPKEDIKLTFNAAGGIPGSTTITHTFGQKIRLPENPTRTGYTFGDWWTASTGGTQVTETTDVPTVNTTYIARWTANEYNISYVLGGGNQSNAPVRYTYGVGATLNTPVRTGYTFDGWYTNSNFTGTKITSISKTAVDGMTLYAKWTAKTYTITYNLNKGKQASGALTRHTYGKVTTLKKPTRTGYTFSGWYTNSKFTGKAITSIAANTTQSTTLYAKWTPKTYKITYKLNNGRQASGALTKHTYNKVTKLKNPTRTGYKFAGWYTNKKFTGKKVTSISKTTAKTVTLYAKWIKR